MRDVAGIKVTFEVEEELSPLDLGILLLSPHSRPRKWSGRGEISKCAKRLQKLGLLEAHPSTGEMHCTSQGEDVLDELMEDRV